MAFLKDGGRSARSRLISRLEQTSDAFKNSRVKSAFESVDRRDFVTTDYLSEAYEDYPLPIGRGQTISQPTTVAFMLGLLGPEEGDKILDVGSGSGWTTALLARSVGPLGKVFGVELIPELAEFGSANIAKYNFGNAVILKAGAEIGLPEESPFDKILVSAAADETPKKLLAQLKVGGTMVLPVRDTIYKITKTSERKTKTEKYPGFAFVPLV